MWEKGGEWIASTHEETTMRIDKLTTKFQEALADAQSQALANDCGFIEPARICCSRS